MARIPLSAEEKRAARALLDGTWNAADVTQAAVQKAAQPFGVNPREAYMSLLHLDTLDAMRDFDFLVFKGGTCIQTYLPPGYQRLSVDLDFNSRHPHKNTVNTAIEGLNKRLEEEGRAHTIQGVPFGYLVPFDEDAQSGTVSFGRYLPTPYDDVAMVGGKEVQARLLRVQINVKHFELPAMDPAKRDVAFFTQPALKPKRAVTAECASMADLFADKVLAITMNVGGFGRERIKDFYDLFALRREKVPMTRVGKKLDIVAANVNHTRADVVKGAMERCDNVRANYLQAKGFVTSACKDGKKLLDHWEIELNELETVLAQLGHS